MKSIFEKDKTLRGFKLFEFDDDYNKKCSLQESSSVEPHIWLGIDKPELRIMFKDSEMLGLGLKKNYPECNEYGWCDYPIPKEVFIESRMHLNQEQAKQLAEELLYFAKTGRLN